MFTPRSLETGGRTFRYLEAGAGWPLVLLHAFPLSADMWRPQLEAPPRGWRLVAPDLRGFGPSGGEAASSMEDMAADVVALLDALEIDKAVIGGLSMGGYVTFALFRSARERFTGLVLANTKATSDTAEGREGRDRMTALVRERGAPAVADQMLPRLLGRTSHESRPHLAAEVRTLIERTRSDGIAGALQAMKARPDSTDLLPRISLPALVVTGDEDALIPSTESEAMAAALPRAQLVRLPAAGHLASLETPDAFSEALGNFLRANL